jgi:hypothetical protein
VGMTVSKLTSGGLAVSQAPAGYGVPCLLGQGQAITVVPSGGLPIADPGGNIFAAAVTYPAWDPATVTAVTLSGGNLVATSTSTSTDQGARVANASGKTAGKFYFEVRLTTVTGGVDTGVGIGTTTSTYAALGTNATVGDLVFTGGNIYANGSPVVALGALTSGALVCIAANFDTRMIWMRLGAAGLWNASGTANPTTNTGGITIPSGTLVPFCTFNASGNVFTANFGATAFTGAVPSGFTSGWPA